MSFADAIRTSLTKYATFSGRARRSEYWFFWLFAAITVVVFGAVGQVIRFPALGLLAYLALILPSLAVTVRRLQDTGRSGWMILLGLIPLVGGIILLVFYVSDSNAAGDKYDPNPKAAALAG